ncbi:MAG: hypothetical protein A4E72_02115 [Syntrophus sp. PtaU1.Bin208]|nr:MAG: hypothetical protein A4E72_02115 [Syntrophus sp. PtaU1.Bin208]
MLLELERRRAEISYVRTRQGFEVDFLARYPSGREELIQVCADVTSPETMERELRSLIEAGRQHPQAHKLLLTLTRDGLPRQVPAAISAQPAYVWLLCPPEHF